MKQWFTSIFICFFSVSIYAASHVPGQCLIQLKSGYDGTQFFSSIRAGQHPYFSQILPVSRHANIYLLKFHNGPFTTAQIISQLNEHPWVALAQHNHRLSWRKAPNDPRYPEQWVFNNTTQTGTMSHINVTSAWDVTTGGKTALGDDIVVAVLDDGISVTHPDLINNLWVNHFEIPDNRVDDDLNGVIDDINGFDASTGQGLVGPGDHGTQVAGLIGASGNNQIGITGINWNLKIMMVKNDLDDLTEADVLTGYNYILEQRKLFNQTSGRNGAYVVATNASFGIDQGQPADAPLWCAVYDSLGHQGILNVGSTTNASVDVDLVGDLPTTCPSDFFIGVTSHDLNSVLTSGYGLKHVDIAAPGVNMLTTSSENDYIIEEGTSFSAPLVSGAIALMHAAPCMRMAQLLKNSPLNGALALKSILLNNISKVAEWSTLLASGGRLNIGASVEDLMTKCSVCPAPANLKTSNHDAAVMIEWDQSLETDRLDLRWRYVGEDWNEDQNIESPYQLNGLKACSAIEVQIRSVCGDLESDYTASVVHQTSCCESPISFTSTASTDSSLTIAWSTQTDAIIYRVEWRKLGDQQFLSNTSTTNQSTIGGLEACTIYEVRVLTVCSDSISQPLNPTLLKTNCPECEVRNYCRSRSTDADFEWIDSVHLNNTGYKSGSNGGYIDLTDSVSLLVMEHEKYDLALVPGFAPDVQSKVIWRVWIDYNFDLDFDDPGEMILESTSRSDSIYTGNFFIPTLNRLGRTIMRVSMKALIDSDTYPAPCDTIFAGEIEDYCIELSTSIKECAQINGYKKISTNTIGMQLQWDTVPNGIAYLIRYKRENAKEFNDWEITMSDTMHALAGLLPCTDYIVQLQSICRFDSSLVYEQKIKTGGDNCTVGTNFVSGYVLDLKVFPNPFFTDINLKILAEKSTSLSGFLYNLQGQLLGRKDFGRLKQGDNNLFWDVPDDFQAGVYLLQLKTDEGISSTKLIKY